MGSAMEASMRMLVRSLLPRGGSAGGTLEGAAVAALATGCTRELGGRELAGVVCREPAAMGRSNALLGRASVWCTGETSMPSAPGAASMGSRARARSHTHYT